MTIIEDTSDACEHRAAGAAATALRRAASLTLDWLMPRTCVLCDAPAREARSGNADRRVAAGAMLCTACRHDIIASMADGCQRCALPLRTASVSRVCGRCLRRPPAFDRTCAAAAYTAPFEQLVRGLKYGATLAYAPLLADLLDERARAGCGADVAAIDAAAIDAAAIDAAAIDVIVPVPLSRDRMASRGFNQAIEIGRVVARRWGKPLDTGSALRIVDTSPQAGLRLDARRRNVRGAFAVTDDGRSRLAGRRVAVIDDVMTTGATLDEFARTLKRAGVACVDNLVVARRR